MIKITPKIILVFLVSIATPTASGIWFLSEMSSRLKVLEDSVANIPSSDNSKILERIKANEINMQTNIKSIEALDADINELVDHVDSGFKKITGAMNSNPLSHGN